VELRAALVQEVLPVPPVVEHPRLADALQPRLLLGGKERQRVVQPWKIERVGRGMDPYRREGSCGVHGFPSWIGAATRYGGAMPNKRRTPLGYAGPRTRVPRDATPRPPGVDLRYVVLYVVVAGVRVCVTATLLRPSSL